MKTKKLNQVRKKIDRLDNKLLQIIKKRTELVKQVIKLKKTKRQCAPLRSHRYGDFSKDSQHVSNIDVAKPMGNHMFFLFVIIIPAKDPTVSVGF